MIINITKIVQKLCQDIARRILECKKNETRREGKDNMKGKRRQERDDKKKKWIEGEEKKNGWRRRDEG